MLDLALRHRFAGFDIDLRFTAPTGVTALFGRSGSGKTTVVNALAGLFRPDEGRILCDDTLLLDTASATDVPPHRRRIGYVFQDARLFPHLTVRQNLLYGRWFARLPGASSFDDIMDLLGIGPLTDRRPGALSGGERQRVAIGRALLSNPRLLALDEPLAALDDARKAEILPYLERLRDDLRLPMVYVSHAMSEVARLATTIVVMEAGRVVASGATDDLLSDPAIAPRLGMRDTGGMLRARIIAHDDDGLTHLSCAAGDLWLPHIPAVIGTRLRLRILAQDVILARDRPTNLSALNIMPVTVRELHDDGPSAFVRLDAAGDMLLARVTRRSVTALGLAPGVRLHAVLKAVAIAAEHVIAPSPMS